MKAETGNPIVTAALAQMAQLRQADPSELTLDAFSAALAEEGMPVADILAACRALGRRERAEGETAFPSLGTLLRVCREAAQARLRAQHQPLPRALPPPVSREEAATWLAKIKAAAHTGRA